MILFIYKTSSTRYLLHECCRHWYISVSEMLDNSLNNLSFLLREEGSLLCVDPMWLDLLLPYLLCVVFRLFFCMSVTCYSALCVTLKSQRGIACWRTIWAQWCDSSEVIILWFINFYLVFISTFWYIILTPPKIQSCFLESTEVKGSLCIFEIMLKELLDDVHKTWPLHIVCCRII